MRGTLERAASYHRPMRLRSVGVSIACTLAVAACSRGQHAAAPTTTTTTASSTTTSTSTTTTVPPFVPQPAAFSPCGVRLQCATVTVPRDYSDPTGPTIDIAINELPARHPDERIGVLLMNPGGPGASGLGFVSGRVALSAAIFDRFDIVG